MRARRRAGPRAGFTLLEMLVVIVILGLAVSLVLWLGPARSPALDLRAGAQAAVEAARAARVQAISEGRPVELLVDPAHHQYLLRGGRFGRVAAPKSVALAGPAGGIAFEPDGSSSGGEIVLAVAGRTATVRVNWLTGRATVAMGARR